MPLDRRRRRRSLDARELYDHWHHCYDCKWHNKLQDMNSAHDVKHIVAIFKQDYQLQDFAIFHNSQLQQPMARVKEALALLGK